MRVIKVERRVKNKRLDKYLAEELSLSRSQTKKLIRQGHVLVNEKLVDPDYEPQKGDTLKVEILPPAPLEVRAEPISLKIVYEDPSIIIIDKDAGMVTHPTLDHPSGTLVNALLHHFKNIPLFGESLRPGIVHRLDKGTSGLLVVAKTAQALENLKAQFKTRTVVKKYLAACSGKIEPAVGIIEAPMARHPKNPKKFTVALGGRQALTNYKVIEYSSVRGKAGFSLVEVEPKTGRTHQIRVHLSHLGHPIIGDRLYGGKPSSRIFLHSACLEFSHPTTGKRIKFESKLPTDLAAVLARLRHG